MENNIGKFQITDCRSACLHRTVRTLEGARSFFRAALMSHPRGDVGIAPYVENTFVFSRIQCFHWTGKTLEGARSFFRAALVPHPRGDVGIAPYAENARFFVGADALIGPRS